MAFAPFDVIIVPFPYADRLEEKRRPAVVVSTPELEARYGLVWLAMITSAENSRWECDVDIVDRKSAGLPAPSRVRPAKLATVNSSRVVRRIGRLATREVKATKAAMRLFGFA